MSEPCFNNRRVGDFPSRTGLYGAWRGSLIFRGRLLWYFFGAGCWDQGLREGSVWQIGVVDVDGGRVVRCLGKFRGNR